MYGFFKQYRSSGMVLGTIHAIRGRIEDGTAYFQSVQPCSNRTVRMNGPDLILKFSNCVNGTERCRICSTIKKNYACETAALTIPKIYIKLLQK